MAWVSHWKFDFEIPIPEFEGECTSRDGGNSYAQNNWELLEYTINKYGEIYRTKSSNGGMYPVGRWDAYNCRFHLWPFRDDSNDDKNANHYYYTITVKTDGNNKVDTLSVLRHENLQLFDEFDGSSYDSDVCTNYDTYKLVDGALVKEGENNG